MNILLLGPQGSGKGTQGELIAQKYNFTYFEAGEYLRTLAQTDKEIDHIVNEVGALIPDERMFQIVSSFLSSKSLFDNIVFDGYPRSLPQYYLLEDFLKQHGTKITIAFALEIPEEITIERLSNRRIDPVTHHVYNLITNPPPATVDAFKLIHREDDTEPVIKKRLASYRVSTEPLVEYLKGQGNLSEVDGTLSIDSIFSLISQKIETLL